MDLVSSNDKEVVPDSLTFDLMATAMTIDTAAATARAISAAQPATISPDGNHKNSPADVLVASDTTIMHSVQGVNATPLGRRGTVADNQAASSAPMDWRAVMMAAQPVANMYSPANVQDKLLQYDFAALGPLFRSLTISSRINHTN